MKTKRIVPTTYLLIAIIMMDAIHFLFPATMIIPLLTPAPALQVLRDASHSSYVELPVVKP